MKKIIYLTIIAALGGLYYRAWLNKPGALQNEFVGLDDIAEEFQSVTYSITDSIGLGDEIMKIWTPPERARPYLAAIDQAEKKHGLPKNLLARLLYQESRYRADIISGKKRSPAGAIGIAQFMPATAAEMGINPLDPWQSIDAAGRYLARLYGRFGNWPEALAAYNWGQGNVSRKGLGKAPQETRNYFAQILGDLGLA